MISVTFFFREPKSAAMLADEAAEWIRNGASWLGGCCGYGPRDIASLRHFLDSQPDLVLPGLKL